MKLYLNNYIELYGGKFIAINKGRILGWFQWFDDHLSPYNYSLIKLVRLEVTINKILSDKNEFDTTWKVIWTLQTQK